MRARSIKPGICDNEVLGTADPFCTLLFERLWLMADRAGRLEDRPMRIKAQAFPYRDGLDVNQLLSWLHEHGFIHRYTVAGCAYIQVCKFSEHQSPHVKEAPSKIPAPDSPGASTSAAPDSAPPAQGPALKIPAPAALTPSSLTPDSGLRTADNCRPVQDRAAAAAPAAVVLHASLPTKEWDEWVSLRRKKRWPMDELTLRKQLELLKDYDGETQRQIINASIRSTWQGLFHPKGGNGTAAPRRPHKDAPTTAELEALEAERAGH